jgi:signal transduction histidine kinase
VLRPGIRGKLATAIVLVVAVALGVAFLAVYEGTRSELRRGTENDLTVKWEEVSSRFLRLADERPPRLAAREAVAEQPISPESFVVSVTLPDGFVATNEPGLLDVGPETGLREESFDEEDEEEWEDGRSDRGDARRNSLEYLTSKEGISEQDLKPLGDVMVLARATGGNEGDSAVIRVAKSVEPVEDALGGLGSTFLTVGILALLAAAVVAWLLASRLTRPLRRLSEVAEDVGGGDLSARMDLDSAGRDETLRLAESFNGMLDRLEAAFDRQRRFVADASHDLRTPLTIIRGQLEVLARDPDPDPAEVARVTAVVNEATGRMERLVADLLALARAEEADQGKSGPVAVRELIDEAASAAVEPDRIEIGEVAQVEIRVDGEAVERALSNLIDNALFHGGPEGRVVVSAAGRGSTVDLIVDDDGPGVPIAERKRIFDRFARLDESRTGASGGSGIGLAIVQAIAEAHGGSVACLDSPAGGARFVITLPAGADHGS